MISKIISAVIVIFFGFNSWAASQGWGWMKNRLGAGLAPDRLFINGEYGYNSDVGSASSYGYLTPTLTHAGLSGVIRAAPVFEYELYGGHTWFYRSWQGTGLVPLGESDPSRYTRSIHQSQDLGVSGRNWVLGQTARVFWSTFSLLPIRLEGMLSFQVQWQWLQDHSNNQWVYDPGLSAVVARHERVHTLNFFGAWRMNPDEEQARRLGVLAEWTSFEKSPNRLARIGPIYQSFCEKIFGDQTVEYTVSLPVRIADAFDERSFGFFVMVSLR